ncbi:hypothetical protein [Flavobacterium sp.]|uniref:hypothetical protein n=1 Tax=Flavobacterium sp. TaxID=239 RepID=UPI0039E6C6CB
MNKIFATFCGLVCLGVSAQEHYSGINTSQRTGIINAGVNPAELVNIESPYDLHIFSVSAKASNNELGFSDLIGSGSFTDKLFAGSGSIDLRMDGEITGPGVAIKRDKWAFALTSKAYARLDLVDVDSDLGDALTKSALDSFLTGSTYINNNNNQRMNGTSWGEIAFSAATVVFEDSDHKLSGGASVKLLFPGSYANFGADSFTGKITNEFGELTLTEARANLNIAYSGNLGEDFSEFSDYTRSLYGKPNGAAVDLGINYRLKDRDGEHYRLSVGAAIRNIGGMTFKSSNNAATNYVLNIQGTDSLNMNQFQDAKSMKEVEAVLLASGFLDKTANEKQSFKVKLPTVISAYADVKIVPSFYVTAFTQIKARKDDENTQIAGQNIISLTPRYTVKNYELWMPFAQSEFSGFSTGLGFRAYGFFIGSGSLITALFDSKQADAYIGYSFQLD